MYEQNIPTVTAAKGTSGPRQRVVWQFFTRKTQLLRKITEIEIEFFLLRIAARSSQMPEFMLSPAYIALHRMSSISTRRDGSPGVWVILSRPPLEGPTCGILRKQNPEESEGCSFTRSFGWASNHFYVSSRIQLDRLYAVTLLRKLHGLSNCSVSGVINLLVC